MMVWVLSIVAVDTECYAEGPDVSVWVYGSMDAAVQDAQAWYIRWTGDDGEEEPQTGHVLRMLEEGRFVSVERGSMDVEIAIREREVLEKTGRICL